MNPTESLDATVPAFTLRASGAVAAALADGTLDLDSGSGLVGVVDNLLDSATCTRLVKAAAHRCRFQRLQAPIRGDSVSWLPLFDECGDEEFGAAFAPARELLVGVAPAIVAYRKAHGGDDDESLLVPRVAQMALYDGSGGDNAGYRAHKDNGGTVDVTGGRLASPQDCRVKGERDRRGAPRDSSNYRELTAILYLNDPSPSATSKGGAAGGELRCHCVDEVARKRSIVDVEPTAGRLVIFRSRQLLHEVLPLKNWQRVALTLWLLLPMPRIAPARAPPPPPTGRRRVRITNKKKQQQAPPAPKAPAVADEPPEAPAAAPEAASGAPGPEDPDEALDREIRDTEAKLESLKALRSLRRLKKGQAPLEMRASAAPLGDGFVSVKHVDDDDASIRKNHDLNRAAMRSGAQLAECVPATACRASDVVAAALRRGDLEDRRPGGLVGVVRGALGAAECATLRRLILDRCRLQNRQPDVRGDGVAWLPLFRKDDDAWNAAFAPARDLLVGVGPAFDANSSVSVLEEPLLIPRIAQVAVYDGSKGLNKGYGAHRDNAFKDTDSVTENHRELTAILYLDGRPGEAQGGDLRCYVGAHPEDKVGKTATDPVDVAPEPGTLVVFKSRHLLHEVLPVVNWTRVAITVWLLRKPKSPLTPQKADLKTILAAMAG